MDKHPWHGFSSFSAQTEIRQDNANDDDKADDVNDGVHDFPSGRLDAPVRAPYKADHHRAGDGQL